MLKKYIIMSSLLEVESEKLKKTINNQIEAINVKITNKDYSRLSVLIKSVETELNRKLKTCEASYISNYRTFDCFAFQCLWAVNPIDRGVFFKDVYKYLNDGHLLTAMKSIFKKEHDIDFKSFEQKK